MAVRASDTILVVQETCNSFDNTNCAESGANKKTEGRATEEEKPSMSATNDVKASTEADCQNKERNSNKPSQKVDDQGRKGNLWILRIAKLAAISFVVLCAIIGATLNKVTLVSITGIVYNVTNHSIKNHRLGSIYFIELVVIMAIPDVVSFFRCLIWGVIGKTAETHPWPSWKSIVMVSVQL